MESKALKKVATIWGVSIGMIILGIVFSTTKVGNTNLGGLLIGFGVLFIGFLYICSVWRVYEKAGKKGWYCIIPIWSQLQEADMSFNCCWLGLLFYIPACNAIYYLIYNYSIACRFGKSSDFAVGNAILPFVFMPLIAFGNCEYRKLEPAK